MISLETVFKDGPQFRAKVAFLESSVNNLETSIKKVSTIIDRMSTLSEEYSEQTHMLIQELGTLSCYPGTQADQDLKATTIQDFTDSMKEIERCRKMMIINIKDVLVEPLLQYANNEITPVKKLGREYQTACDNYQYSLSRYVAKRPNDSGVKELGHQVSEGKRSYHKKALEYANALNELTRIRQSNLIENIISFFYTKFAFFHQGFEHMKQIEPKMQVLSNELKKELTKAKSEFKPAPSFVTLLKPDDEYNPYKDDDGKAIKDMRASQMSLAPQKSGYLYKRVIGKVRTTWVRTFFDIYNDSLCYYNDSKMDESIPIDLRICMVREANLPDRRWSFELINPTETFVLQAENDNDMKEWIVSIQIGIQRALHVDTISANVSQESISDSNQDTSKNKSPTQNKIISPKEVIKQVTGIPGNEVCAECNTKEQSEWVCCNLGIVVCITCSGIHRGLGRQVSKIRSLSLDKWESSTIQVLCALGNTQANQVYEAFYKKGMNGIEKPKPNDDILIKEQYIFAKYVQKMFIKDPTGREKVTDLDYMIKKAIQRGNLAEILYCIANGVNLNYVDLLGQTCVHVSVISRRPLALEFLTFWNVDLNSADNSGKTPLHYAVLNKDLEIVSFLLKKKVYTGLHDMKNMLPVDYAVELARQEQSEEMVNLSTLLRLTTLNTENTTNWKNDNQHLNDAIEELVSTSPPVLSRSHSSGLAPKPNKSPGLAFEGFDSNTSIARPFRSSDILQTTSTPSFAYSDIPDMNDPSNSVAVKMELPSNMREPHTSPFADELPVMPSPFSNTINLNPDSSSNHPNRKKSTDPLPFEADPWASV